MRPAVAGQDQMPEDFRIDRLRDAPDGPVCERGVKDPVVQPTELRELLVLVKLDVSRAGPGNVSKGTDDCDRRSQRIREMGFGEAVRRPESGPVASEGKIGGRGGLAGRGRTPVDIRNPGQNLAIVLAVPWFILPVLVVEVLEAEFRKQRDSPAEWRVSSRVVEDRWWKSAMLFAVGSQRFRDGFHVVAVGIPGLLPRMQGVAVSAQDDGADRKGRPEDDLQVAHAASFH